MLVTLCVLLIVWRLVRQYFHAPIRFEHYLTEIDRRQVVCSRKYVIRSQPHREDFLFFWLVASSLEYLRNTFKELWSVLSFSTITYLHSASHTAAQLWETKAESFELVSPPQRHHLAPLWTLKTAWPHWCVYEQHFNVFTTCERLRKSSHGGVWLSCSCWPVLHHQVNLRNLF